MTTASCSGMQGGARRDPPRAGAVATVAARRAGPREHGRQAARSKRCRPCGQMRDWPNPATCASPEAAP
jgi:hypothetical protein